jgi:hypothetical protein
VMFSRRVVSSTKLRIVCAAATSIASNTTLRVGHGALVSGHFSYWRVAFGLTEQAVGTQSAC